MCRSWSVVCLMILAVGGASCSEDPETAKRRYLDEGNSYMASKKYPEAIISYRNAVSMDDRFGEARLKLAEAYLAPGTPECASRIGARRRPPTRQRRRAVTSRIPPLGGEAVSGGARARHGGACQGTAETPEHSSCSVTRWRGLKDLDAAIEQVEQAIDEDPQLTLSYANLGCTAVGQG